MHNCLLGCSCFFWFCFCSFPVFIMWENDLNWVWRMWERKPKRFSRSRYSWAATAVFVSLPEAAIGSPECRTLRQTFVGYREYSLFQCSFWKVRKESVDRRCVVAGMVRQSTDGATAESAAPGSAARLSAVSWVFLRLSVAGTGCAGVCGALLLWASRTVVITKWANRHAASSW